MVVDLRWGVAAVEVVAKALYNWVGEAGSEVHQDQEGSLASYRGERRQVRDETKHVIVEVMRKLC